ncbi:APC family permease [Schlesneria paludicola]|uniref:APC family permease n=1 Tax=Schlesneria paludicola TaxID=360056 RepID=UPI00029AC7AD|nr:amino acid permease [Schlesneria paludicola]
MSEKLATDEEESGPLSLWDAVSLIIGIVIGSTIYKTPGLIFSNVPNPWAGLGLWVLCGFLSFVGALCYAELATTYPRSGGEYNYLSRAYGSWAGFLFGWSQLAIIQTGSIGALSYVFAEYAAEVFNAKPDTVVWFALAAVIGLTALNMIGLHAGRHVQKALVVAKLLGLVLTIIAGLSSRAEAGFAVKTPVNGPGWPLAMILVLYAYGGWNDAAFVTAEVKNRSRNIPRALLLGMGLISIVYLLINFAYLRALGFEGLRNSSRPAADALSATFGGNAGRIMSLLVMISALGGLNGLILAVSRVHATVGADHALFARLGYWSPRTHTPVWSLFVQGAVTVLMIAGIGTEAGRRLIDELFRRGSIPAVPWDRYFNSGFETLYAASAPIFWLFFLSTGIAYFVLRVKDHNRLRPFSAPWFPLCPILFCATCAFGLYSSVNYAAPLLPLIAVPFLAGLPLFAISQWLGRKPTQAI